MILLPLETVYGALSTNSISCLSLYVLWQRARCYTESQKRCSSRPLYSHSIIFHDTDSPGQSVSDQSPTERKSRGNSWQKRLIKVIPKRQFGFLGHVQRWRRLQEFGYNKQSGMRSSSWKQRAKYLDNLCKVFPIDLQKYTQDRALL